MGGAIASFSAMAVAGRAVSHDHDTFELMLYRSLIGLLLVLAVSSLAGTRASIRPGPLALHLVRNLFHFAGQNLWFFALTLVPLAQVFALEFTAPLWVLVLAPVVLGERITPPQAWAALIGFIGVLAVTRPFSAPLTPGLLAAASAAIGFAVSAIFTRRLIRTESVTSVLFWLTAMQAVFGFGAAALDGQIALPTAAAAPWLVLIGIAGLTAHFCLTSALRLAPASTIMPVDFLRLPLIAFIGWAFYGETLDPWVATGAVLIVAGNWINLALTPRKL
ncbi:MAG TPA: DMT family transporter [Rhodobacterales bacterium]|nr:DMT family transporter [Rhodobacterales bacterium]